MPRLSSSSRKIARLEGRGFRIDPRASLIRAAPPGSPITEPEKRRLCAWRASPGRRLSRWQWRSSHVLAIAPDAAKAQSNSILDRVRERAASRAESQTENRANEQVDKTVDCMSNPIECAEKKSETAPAPGEVGTAAAGGRRARARRAAGERSAPTPEPMESPTKSLTLGLRARMALKNTTPRVEAIGAKSGVRRAMAETGALEGGRGITAYGARANEHAHLDDPTPRL